MRLVWEPEPIVEFSGEDPEAAEAERKAEAVYNHVFKVVMDTVDPLAYVIDGYMHRGFYFIQVGWEFATDWEVRVVRVKDLIPKQQGQQQQQLPPEKIVELLALQYELYLDDPRVKPMLERASKKILEGAETVTVAYRRVIKDRPAIWDRDPMQIIAPPRTVDYPNAEWIIIQHVLSSRKLKQMAADGFFRKSAMDRVVTDVGVSGNFNKDGDGGGTSTSMGGALDQEKLLQDRREKIWGVEDQDNVLVWEIYHWYDHNNDGLLDRTVSWIHPRTKTNLATRPYVLPFNEWPLEKIDFEKTNRRWHSPRGIPQMLQDLQIVVNAQHNARLDGMTLRNAPIYQTSLLAGIPSRSFRSVPGTLLQLNAGAEIKPIIHDHSPFPEQVAEENLIRTMAEQYVGIFDANITSPQSNTRARTATEVQAIVQYTAATATFDAILFQDFMRKVHTKVWQLFMDLGPEEIYVKIAGQDPESNDSPPTKVTKAEINKKFKLIPTGSVANTNRALELSNAREAMQFFINDQTGLVNPYELRKWYLMLLTSRWYRRILNPPAQAAREQVLNQAAQALQSDPRVMTAMRGPASAEPVDMPRQEVSTGGQYGGTNGV